MKWFHYCVLCVFLLAVFSCSEPPATSGTAAGDATPAADAGGGVPSFEVDPFWPKPLPNNWLIGQVSGIAVDSADNVWLIHRPGSLTADEAGAVQDPPLSICCVPAPPVIQFDGEGNVLQTWEGPGDGYEWPATEHGIYVDYKDNVWVGGSGADDHQILKFDKDGNFLLQIGQAGKTGGSNDTEHLGQPADITVDPEANEVYVADGYRNRRIIVFDADTGEYKRHWGAYGEPPDDAPAGDYDPSAPPLRQFRTPTHAVRISNDGLVYVGDRVNDRVQVFQKDGTFEKEVIIAKDTRGPGSAWDVDFSPDQEYLYVADGTNQQVWILVREDLSIVGSFGRNGRNAGQFHWLHNVAVDSKGNMYTGEVDTGKRAQKFVVQ